MSAVVAEVNFTAHSTSSSSTLHMRYRISPLSELLMIGELPERAVALVILPSESVSMEALVTDPVKPSAFGERTIVTKGRPLYIQCHVPANSLTVVVEPRCCPVVASGSATTQ